MPSPQIPAFPQQPHDFGQQQAAYPVADTAGLVGSSGAWNIPIPPSSDAAAPSNAPAPGLTPGDTDAAASGGATAEDLARRNRHGDPVLRRMGRGVRKLMGASAAQDARLLSEVTAKLQLPVSTCRQIAVTSVRGGAGKTTVTALAASMAAKYRQDRVLTIDADTGLGSLPLRLGARAQLSLHELATAQPASWDDSTRYLAQTSEGLWVLSGTTGGRLAEELEINKYYTAFGTVSRYFSTTFVDCGAGIVNQLQRGILSGAHGQILVTPATVDGAVSALGAIEWFNSNGYAGLLQSTVITLVTHTPHSDSDLDKATEMLSTGGMPVFHIPYDRHLATGTAIDLERISESARTSATRIAAEVFARSAGR